MFWNKKKLTKEERANALLLSFTRMLTVLEIKLRDGHYLEFVTHFNDIQASITKIMDSKVYEDMTQSQRFIIIGKVNRQINCIERSLTPFFKERKFFVDIAIFYIDLVLNDSTSELSSSEMQYLKGLKERYEKNQINQSE